MLTWRPEEKQQDFQDAVDQVLRAAYPLIVPTTEDVNMEEFQITLTSQIFIPEGMADRTSTTLTEPDGTKEELCLWREIPQGVWLGYKSNTYCLDLKDDTDQPIQLTIKKKGALLGSNTGTLTARQPAMPAFAEKWVESGKYRAVFSQYSFSFRTKIIFE